MPRAALERSQRYTTWRELDPVLLKAAEVLTDRDRRLIASLCVHRVLTTEQVMQLFFRNPTTTQHRLLRLERYGLLTRFRPWKPVGTAQSHWSLDIPGLLVAAASLAHDRLSRRPEETPEALLQRVRRRRQSLDALAHSSHLAHRVETTNFFTRLICDARTHNDGRAVPAWWNERQLSDKLQLANVGGLRPDGYGAWQQDGRTVEFFLEHDRGTEPLARLKDKLHAYPQLIVWLSRPVVILFVVTNPRRLAHVIDEVLPVGLDVNVTVAVAAARDSSPSTWPWREAGSLPTMSLGGLPLAGPLGPEDCA